MNQKNIEVQSPRVFISDESTIDDILKLVAEAVDDKKGEDLVILDLSTTLDYLDYIVICTGSTDIQNRAIADHIKDELASCDIIPERLHGYNHGKWILLDYDVMVVHVFTPDLREYYRLEDLWAGGNKVDLT